MNNELNNLRNKFSVKKLSRLNYFKVLRAVDLNESIQDSEFERLLNITVKQLLDINPHNILSLKKYRKSYKMMERYVMKNIFKGPKYNFEEGLKSFVKSNTMNIGKNLGGAGIVGASAMKAVDMTFDKAYNQTKKK